MLSFGGLGFGGFTGSFVGADTTAPTLVGQPVIGADGLTVTATYSEALDPTSVPPAAAYALPGSGRYVTGVNVTGSAVQWTLNAAIRQGATGLVVDYTPPTTGKVRDATGNNAAALSGQAITNSSTVTAVTAYASWRADSGVTLSTTMLAGGTSPPVVTLSGAGLALTTAALRAAGGIRVEIDSVAGGTALGQATFRVSYNNGASWAHSGVPTAATYALDGNATGITLNFPAGTYGTTQNWQATVTSWADVVGGLVMSVGSTSKQPLYLVAGYNGLPCVDFDGSNDEMQCTDAGLIAKMVGPLPNTVIAAVQLDNKDHLGAILGAGGTAATNRTRRWGVNSTGDGVWRVDAVDDAGTVAQQETSSTEPHTDLLPHVAAWVQNGTTVTFQVDTAPALLSAVAFAPGATMTLARVALGARPDSVSDSFLNGKIAEVSFFDEALDANEFAVAIDDRRAYWALSAPGPNIVDEGDSLTNCFGSVSGVVMSDRVTIAGATKYNVATNGQRLSTHMLPGYPSAPGSGEVRGKYALGNPNNIVVLAGGNNDIFLDGRTGAQVYADMQSYAALAHATGFRVIAENVTYRNTGNGPADDLKALLDADHSFLDVYVDTLARLQSELTARSESPGVVGSLYSDTAHGTDEWYDIRAAMRQAAIKSLLR